MCVGPHEHKFTNTIRNCAVLFSAARASPSLIATTPYSHKHTHTHDTQTHTTHAHAQRLCHGARISVRSAYAILCVLSEDETISHTKRGGLKIRSVMRTILERLNDLDSPTAQQTNTPPTNPLRIHHHAQNPNPSKYIDQSKRVSCWQACWLHPPAIWPLLT